MRRAFNKLETMIFWRKFLRCWVVKVSLPVVRLTFTEIQLNGGEENAVKCQKVLHFDFIGFI